MSEAWRVDANEIFFDDLKAGMKSQKYEQCPACNTYFLWDKIPDELVKTATEHEQFWGAPCSYETVIGYICPNCGEDIQF